ncbi:MULTISPECIES: phosphotransferase [Streptomyces]|uniref:phosphotransferase n=1 Tax=Streptomyces TaxID=1883 RepID=UPI00093D62E4|nr:MULTISPECIES: phosphotransferase [unclassified Streptomyces]OKJ12275.1 phosphotransferase [Streptomyces sp. TSRI0261]QNQ36270.1 phosphotransferase [Streptomyces sp. CB00271]
MKDRPTDIDEAVLASALGAWGVEPVTLTHAPVGFGDHHWVAADAEDRRTFVTVADLAHKPHCGRDAAEAWTGLSRAMDTAATLESALGEAALVAPLRTGDGETLLRLTDRYAVSVFPYVDAPTGRFGQVLDPGARRLVVERLAQLHSTQRPLMTPTHQPGLPGRPVIEGALTDSRRFRAESGPYAQRCQALLTTNYAALRAALEHFDSGTARLASDASTAAVVTVTHGEPHAGNILDPGGRTLLVDWDTVALAPPERDLWLATDAPEDLTRYAELTGHHPDPDLLAYYELRWALDDMAAALDIFGARHPDTADTRQAWDGLVDAVSALTALTGGAADVGR